MVLEVILMGTWGTSLYANDTTCDVRGTYMDILQDQLGNQEAYEKTLEKLREYLSDPDEAPLFWYALADTQWNVGRLIPEVKDKAMEWISRGGGLELYENSKVGNSGWQRTLDKLKAKLDTEQRKEKKISKKLDQNLWNIGDVYAYQFHTDISKKYGVFGKYMVLQKIGEDPYTSDDDLVMRVHVFDMLFSDIPTMEDLKGVRLLPLDFLTTTDDLHMSKWLLLYKKRAYPKNFLTFMCNTPIPANKIRKHILISDGNWDSIERWGLYFDQWKGIKYETVEDGIFRYTRPKMPVDGEIDAM